MVGFSFYIIFDLCMFFGFLYYLSFIIIYFNFFEYLNWVIVKFDRVIYILELKKLLCNLIEYGMVWWLLSNDYDEV